MKIMVAVPCMYDLPVPFVKSLIALNRPDSTDLTVKFQSGSLIYDARNLISLEAIRDGYDYVMWLDSDMTFQHDIITRLLDDMNTTGSEIITGLYVKRTYPTTPVIYDIVEPPTPDENGILQKNIRYYINYPLNQIFQIAGCGFGCVLTKVSLLKRVWDTFSLAFNPLPWASEDHSFCYRVNQLNEKILCDSRISCGHIGTFLYTDKMLTRGDDN